MISLLIFTALLSGVLGAEIACTYAVTTLGYSCHTYNASILVTVQNEPITVTGTQIGTRTVNDVQRIGLNGEIAQQVLKFVPTKMFEIFPNLEYLHIYSAQITTMTTNAFTSCLKLDKVVINYNNFPELPASVAESCVNLKHLQFFGNNIKTVHKDALKGLANLIELYFGEESFEYLDPSTFVHVPKLTHLLVNFGKLKSIDANLLAPLLAPVWVTFIQNQIEFLPALKFKSISNLANLIFRQNQITRIDPDFLKNYPGNRESYSLDLESNNCTNQVYTISQQFVSLQPCFDNWNKSQTMTTLAAVPSNPAQPCTSCSSHKVCRFYLDHDEVYTCVISGVELALQSISGDHETINGKTFTDSDVKAVYLKNSVLSRVPGVIFTKFPSVEFLSIPSTQMTIIDDNTFQSCGNLKQLDASENFIFRITKTSLQKCQKLETINLVGNPIEFVDAELFKLDPQLKHVILIQNP